MILNLYNHITHITENEYDILLEIIPIKEYNDC